MYKNLQFGVAVKILLSKFRYRDRANIVLDILDTVGRDPKGKTKTSIMRGANLNFAQVNRYLEALLFRGFIKEIAPIKSQELVRYIQTKKGFLVVKHLDPLRDAFR